jgi:hypothetical protein
MTNKDLISQYVDTGIGISEYQVNQLSNNDKKTYIRKRWLSIKNSRERLSDFEIKLLSDEQKYIYNEDKIVRGFVITDYAYSLLNDELKEIYQRQILNKPSRYMAISIKQYSELPNVKQKDDLKQELLRYFNVLIDTGWDIKPREVEFKKYLENEQ